jgi:hypothetical protein
VATLEPHPLGGLSWSRSGTTGTKADRIREMLANGMPATAVAAELSTATSFVYRVRTEMQRTGELPSRKSSPGPVSPFPLPKAGGKGKKARGQGAGKGENRGVEGN